MTKASPAAAPRVPLPKYESLSAELRSIVESAAVGTPIASERTLAEQYGVSRMTARRAVMELMTAGLLDRQVGRGTFVTRPRFQVHLALNSFSQDMQRRGRTPGAIVLEAVGVAAQESESDAFDPADELVLLVRLRTGDGIPIAIERTYLLGSSVPGLLDGPQVTGSLYELLAQRYGIAFQDGEQTIRAVACPADVAERLTIEPGQPVFHMERRSRAAHRVVEHTLSTYRADIYELAATLRSDPA